VKFQKELDVDFIGGQHTPLTKEEEKAISDFIRADKERRRRKGVKEKGKTKQIQLV
jgi:hypothetical protein